VCVRDVIAAAAAADCAQNRTRFMNHIAFNFYSGLAYLCVIIEFMLVHVPFFAFGGSGRQKPSAADHFLLHRENTFCLSFCITNFKALADSDLVFQ